MNYTCLPYDPSLRPLYESLAKSCREQEDGDFPVPEVEEGETGVLFLCKKKDTVLGALSAVTYDCSQYYFYPWCLEEYRQEVGPALCRRFEEYLMEMQELPLLLSAYVKGSAGTAQMLQEQGYVCTTGEYMMCFEISQISVQNASAGSSDSIQCTVCRDQKTLQRLYQDIFSTGKREAEAYMTSIIEEPEVELFTISGTIPCDSPRKGFLKGRNRQGKKGLLGMFGLLPQGDTVYLFGFGILSSYRRQGLGLAALQEICVMLQNQYRQIAVQVSGSNLPAMELYRSFGFQVQEHVDLYEKELHADSLS